MVYSVTTFPFTRWSLTTRRAFSGGNHFHHRLILADADAAGLGNYHILQVALGHLVHHGGEHWTGAGGNAAGGHTHQNPDAVVGLFPQADLG